MTSRRKNLYRSLRVCRTTLTQLQLLSPQIRGMEIIQFEWSVESESRVRFYAEKWGFVHAFLCHCVCPQLRIRWCSWCGYSLCVAWIFVWYVRTGVDDKTIVRNTNDSSIISITKNMRKKHGKNNYRLRSAQGTSHCHNKNCNLNIFWAISKPRLVVVVFGWMLVFLFGCWNFWFIEYARGRMHCAIRYMSKEVLKFGM